MQAKQTPARAAGGGGRPGPAGMPRPALPSPDRWRLLWWVAAGVGWGARPAQDSSPDFSEPQCLRLRAPGR